MRNKWLLIFGVLALFLTVGWAGRGQTESPENVKWEYQGVYAHSSQMPELNRVGAAGWELVTATGETDKQIFFVFKRRK